MTERTIQERLRLAAEPDWQGFPQFGRRTAELLQEAAAEFDELRSALSASVSILKERNEEEALEQ
jgi:hypothetical protein